MATPQNTEIKRKYNTNLRQGVSGLMQSGEDERFVRFVAYREGYDPEEIDNEINLYKRMASGADLTEEKDTSEVGAAATKKLQESVASRTALIKNLQSYKSLIDSHGFESGIGKDSAKILGEMKSLRGEITATYKKAETLGALDVGVQKLVSTIIGQEPKLGFSDENEGLEFPTLNIGGWKSAQTSAALESAIKNAQLTLDTDVATLKSGFDLNRDSQITQPIQPDNEDKAAFDWMKNNPNHQEYERVKSQVESRFGTSDLSVLSGTLNPETSQDTPGLVNPETNEIKSSGFFETISPEEKAKNFEKNLANARAQETQAKSESDYANSFTGFMNNFLGALGENTGMKKFGQGIGSALFLNSQAGKELQDKAVAGDKDALEVLNQILAEAPNTKELLGSAALTALNALSGGLASKTASQIPKVSGLASKIIKGGSVGYAYDAASHAEENKPTGEVFKPGLGTVIGASVPAVLKVNDVLKARKALNLSTEEIIKSQIDKGLRPNVDIETLSKSTRKKIKEAIKQNFSERDIQFLISMAPEDRVAAGKMINLADAVNSNARTLQRPIDIAGETLVNKLKLVTKEVNNAGRAVDKTAKSLRGQMVDATSIQDRATKLFENLGITYGKKGKLDFKNSVFKLTPGLQSEIQKFSKNIPGSMDDAYNLHIFKKSIDELVSYGAQGEGLKGNAQSILKSLRNATDEVLDSNFNAYNTANTRFKKAKEIVDASQDLFGKKNTLASSVRGGQVLRSAFSNNTSRSRVYDLAERLDIFEKEMTGTVKNNALDQAIFAELLDKSGLYTTQAITGLAGQVETAVKKAGAVVEGISNPIRGVATLVSGGIEKMKNINPQAKKKILKDLLRGVLGNKSQTKTKI